MRKLIFLLALVAVLFTSCQNDDDSFVQDSNQDFNLALENALREAGDASGLDFFKMPESDDFNAIPQDPKNPITADKVELGKMLFHEAGLGVNPKFSLGKNTYSCASCHFASAGFQAGRQQGMGEGGIGFGMNGEARTMGALYNAQNIDVQPIRSPSAMNAAYQELMLWNGQFGGTAMNAGTEWNWTEGTPKAKNNLGFQGIETQAIAGLEVHRMAVDEALVTELGYKEMFDNTFADLPVGERYTTLNAGLAIAAYERTLLSNKAPFQKWLKGEKDAMSSAELEGAVLFFTKAACVDCHTGPALNKMSFEAIGMKDLFQCDQSIINASSTNIENKGRGGFNGNADDDYKFKVPQLYNLKSSPFYGHGASFRSIKDVIAYKNKAEAENQNVSVQQLSEHFKPLDLSNDEIDKLTLFVSKSLFDPSLGRYQPESVESGLCIPVSDVLSSYQLGCE